MPQTVEMRLTIPAELGPEAEVVEELRPRAAAAVASLAAERQRAGQRVYGRRAVLQQAWWGGRRAWSHDGTCDRGSPRVAVHDEPRRRADLGYGRTMASITASIASRP